MNPTLKEKMEDENKITNTYHVRAAGKKPSRVFQKEFLSRLSRVELLRMRTQLRMKNELPQTTQCSCSSNLAPEGFCFLLFKTTTRT
jgi:hypothetical protein